MADGSGMRKAGLDGLPCGICLVSMDDEERVLYANRSFLLLMGFSSMEELFSQRGSSFKGLVAEGYVPLGQRCGAEERSGSFYFQLRTSSGSIPVKGRRGSMRMRAWGRPGVFPVSVTGRERRRGWRSWTGRLFILPLQGWPGRM